VRGGAAICSISAETADTDNVVIFFILGNSRYYYTYKSTSRNRYRQDEKHTKTRGCGKTLVGKIIADSNATPY
jgi:hypothetical protein